MKLQVKVAIHDADANFRSRVYPNLPLMKIAAYYKKHGYSVEWFMPLNNYDIVYSSKVFTFHKNNPYLPKNAILGGIGYSKFEQLPEEIEHIMPDYSIYPTVKASYGFTTRGCIRSCSWCIVPKKEGKLKAHAEIEEFLRKDSREIVLMDNNIVACEHGLLQLEKAAKLNLIVDCNQGIDARIVAGDVAIQKLLAKIQWKYLRFACDTSSQKESIEKAVLGIRKFGKKRFPIMCYCLVKDIEDALERVEFLRSLQVDPFAQPYIDFSGKVEITKEQKAFARWVNRKELFKSCQWKDYKYIEKK